LTEVRAEVDIRSIGAGGVGVGNLADGRVVFVPRSAPGDRVRIRLTREKERWARGRLEAVLNPSPDRRTPPCPLYDQCGGCALQHISYEEQLRWKGRIVGDAIRRIGGRRTEDPQVAGSPTEFDYRNKLSLAFRRSRGGRIVAGFHALDAPDTVLDVHGECLLPVEPLRSLWIRLREGWGPGGSLLPEGRELRLTLRAEDPHEGTILIEGGKGGGNPEALLSAVAGLTSIWWQSPGGEVRHLAGARAVRVAWMEETVELAGGAFLQVNSAAGQLLHRFVHQRAGEGDPQRVLEGYCGTGALGRALAREGREVVGIELDPLAAGEALRDSPPTFQVVEGPVEDHLADHLPADLVLLNPPRSGLDEGVSETLRRRPTGRLIYISCDPATLARDLKRMGSHYRIETLQCFDLFPQTSHVETVAILTGPAGR